MVHASDNKMLRSPGLQIVIVLLSRILLAAAVDTGGINDGGGSAYGNAGNIIITKHSYECCYKLYLISLGHLIKLKDISHVDKFLL